MTNGHAVFLFRDIVVPFAHLAPHVGAELERYMEDVVLRYDRRAANLWRSKGGEVIRLSTADRDEFMARTAKIGGRIMGGDAKLAPMYNKLKACAATTRLTDHENKKGSGL